MLRRPSRSTLPAPGGASGEPQPGRHLVFGVVSIALFMAAIDQTIVATCLFDLQHDLHARLNWATWTITIYSLGQIVAMPVAGSISDLYGRKRVFLAAVGLFTVTSLLCGLVSNIYELVPLRALQALGGGAFMPSATGIVSDQYGRERDRAVGMFTSIFPIGGIVGPVLGGVFVTYWSWRGIFLVNVPVGVALLLLAGAVLPDSRSRQRRRLDVPGIALLTAGLLAVMVAVTHLGSASVSPLSAGFLLPLAAGVAALGGFVRHAARAPHPFIAVRLLAAPGFAPMNFINYLFGITMLGFGALVPLYAEQRYHMDTLAAGTLLTARAIGMIAVAGLAAVLLRRTGYRRPMAAGTVVSAVGLVVMAASPWGMSAYLWLALSAAIIGIGLGTAMPATNNAMLQLAPESAASIAGLRGMFRQAGGITGVSVISAILARSSDPGIAQAQVFVVLAVLLMAMLPLLRVIPEHRGAW